MATRHRLLRQLFSIPPRQRQRVLSSAFIGSSIRSPLSTPSAVESRRSVVLAVDTPISNKGGHPPLNSMPSIPLTDLPGKRNLRTLANDMRATIHPSLGARRSLVSRAPFLKRFLVASVVPYYYYFCCGWLGACELRADGLLLGTETNNYKRNHNSRVLHGSTNTFRRHTHKHLRSELLVATLFQRTGSRLFSTSAGDGVEEFVGETSNQKQPDSHQTTEEETTFATNYHAPVMVHECLDALLDCQQGRIRNPNPKLSKKMKKKKKKHRKPKTVRSEAENEASEEITTSTSAPDSDPGLPQPPPLIFVDGTLGGGGHSSALLQRLRPGDVLLGCDVDPNALATASERLAEYVNHSGADRPLFLPVRTNFGDLAQTLPTVNHPVTGLPVLGESGGVDGILLDLGVSSHQIDAAERGFSFMRDGPLDMRMGRDSGQEGIVDESNTNSCGLTAADICNEFDEGELQRIFSVYGDEPRAKTVARSIVQHRPLHTTGGLVEAIASVTPAFARNKRHGKTATCARVFQSLRIVVNNEDGVLGKVLTEACPALLNPGGRLVVMSYHSMEDRATKRIMRDGTLEKARTSSNEKDLYGNYIGPPKPFRPVQKRQKATEDEIARNSRARSAILRVAERLHDGKN